MCCVVKSKVTYLELEFKLMRIDHVSVEVIGSTEIVWFNLATKTKLQHCFLIFNSSSHYVSIFTSFIICSICTRLSRRLVTSVNCKIYTNEDNHETVVQYLHPVTTNSNLSH